MTKIDIKLIKKLREATGAPMMRVKKVLDEVGGSAEEAEKILKQEGFAKAAKRASRETLAGLVKAYTHHSGKLVGVVELLCETDFVAKNELFVNLANDLAMQVASMNPNDAEELSSQDFIKVPEKKVGDLVQDVIAKTGENVRIARIYRIEIGK